MKRFCAILAALLLISACSPRNSVTPGEASPSGTSPSTSPSEVPSESPQLFNVEFTYTQELIQYMRFNTAKSGEPTYYEFFLYQDHTDGFEKYGFSPYSDIYLLIRYDYDGSTVLAKLFEPGIYRPGMRLAYITGAMDWPDILVSGYHGGSGGTSSYALLSFEDMVVTDLFAEAGLTRGLTQEMLEPLYAKHGITAENPETKYQSISLVGADAMESTSQSNNQRLLVISNVWENGLPRDTVGTLYVTMRYIDGEWTVEHSLYEKSPNFP